MNQEDALIFDNYADNWQMQNTNDNVVLCDNQLQCKWENCYQIYETQSSLVRHIEKAHVELKRGNHIIFLVCK